MDISSLATKADLEKFATKADFNELRIDLKTLEQSTKADTNMLLEALKNLYSSQEDWKNELKEHFEVVVEELRHDMIGTHKDKISTLDDRTIDHGRRIRHLEKRLSV